MLNGVFKTSFHALLLNTCTNHLGRKWFLCESTWTRSK